MILVKSKKYDIPANKLAAILMQESGYNLTAKRKHCGYDVATETRKTCVTTDYGIAQIHWKNLERYKFDKVKLTTDLDYSVDAGAKVLSEKKRFRAKEPTIWWSRYNCGTAKFEKIKTSCTTYSKLVARYM